MMKTLVGLWVDHRKAVIVILSDKGQETRRVEFHVQKQLRCSGRSPAHLFLGKGRDRAIAAVIGELYYHDRQKADEIRSPCCESEPDSGVKILNEKFPANVGRGNR